MYFYIYGIVQTFIYSISRLRFTRLLLWTRYASECECMYACIKHCTDYYETKLTALAYSGHYTYVLCKYKPESKSHTHILMCFIARVELSIGQNELKHTHTHTHRLVVALAQIIPLSFFTSSPPPFSRDQPTITHYMHYTPKCVHTYYISRTAFSTHRDTACAIIRKSYIA